MSVVFPAPEEAAGAMLAQIRNAAIRSAAYLKAVLQIGDEHSIAEREKPVFFPDCFVVGI